MNKRFKTVLMMLMALVFAASVFMAAQHIAGYRTAEESSELAQEVVAATPKIELPTLDFPDPDVPLVAIPTPEPVEPLAESAEYLLSLDLNSLREVNGDVMGWIVIPDTRVDYPLMDGEDNNEYLTTTWDGKRANAGSIFMECQTSRDFSDFNTIIYGHNMKGGSMFATLKSYADQSFWEEHPEVYIVTDELVRRYEIYSSYEAEVVGPAYWLGTPKESARESFLEYSTGRSVIETGIEPEIDDSILTLSTCTGNGTYQTRWVAQAVLTGEFER